MKIQSMNKGDFDVIDRAFRFTMGEQALRLRNAVQDGNMGNAKMFLESLRDSMGTYEKIQKEIEKYGE